MERVWVDGPPEGVARGGGRTELRRIQMSRCGRTRGTRLGLMEGLMEGARAGAGWDRTGSLGGRRKAVVGRGERPHFVPGAAGAFARS